MFRITAIVTCMCFTAVSILEAAICSLCLLVTCPVSEPDEVEPPPPCRSCPSMAEDKVSPCQIPDEPFSDCRISPCFLPDQPPPPVCAVNFDKPRTLSTGHECQINLPHLGDLIAERRTLETEASVTDIDNIDIPDFELSGNIYSQNLSPPGIHHTISTTILRL